MKYNDSNVTDISEVHAFCIIRGDHRPGDGGTSEAFFILPTVRSSDLTYFLIW